MAECMRCGAEIGKATYCGCGWNKYSKKSADKPSDPYPLRCSYLAGNDRCCYAGAISHSTTGSDKWFCSAHFNLTDPVLGADIVDQSKKFIPKSKGDEFIEAMDNYAAEKRLLEGTSSVGRGWAKQAKILIDAGMVKTTPTSLKMIEDTLKLGIVQD